MINKLNTILNASKGKNVQFSQVIELIDTYYQHQPTAFKNGDAYNDSTQNQGSAKVFAFAQLNNINEADTLYLFAEHYQSVLANPEGKDHQNIRQFMVNGWSGITFEGLALTAK